jgi:hypothetical protein
MWIDDRAFRGATAQAGDDAWRFVRSGLLVPAVHATDSAGGAAGLFKRDAMGAGGSPDWAGRRLQLRWKFSLRITEWALLYGERSLATFQVREEAIDTLLVTLDDDGPYVPPGLLLFGAFVAKVLSDDALSTFEPM